MGHQLLRVDQRADAIKRVFLQNHQRLLRMVPRTAGDPNRLITIAFSTIALDADLVRCTPESLFGGVIETLKLGLTTGGPLQESWLIPFRDAKRNVMEATLIIGYQGYRTLIDRAKAVLDLHPRAVYAGDEFDVEYGSAPRVHHKPAWLLGRSQGEFVAAYAVARLRGGGIQIEVMPKAEIDEHRARSRAKDKGPWVTDYVPMALKTTIRKIAKYLPKASYEMARALELDERADRGAPQGFDLSDLDLSAVAALESGAEPVADERLSTLVESDAASPAPARSRRASTETPEQPPIFTTE
ncbi:MAG: recombinase RecT [Armatimonadota bacterium]|nr:recombinase RecT [Armatimonadota bacterium]